MGRHLAISLLRAGASGTISTRPATSATMSLRWRPRRAEQRTAIPHVVNVICPQTRMLEQVRDLLTNLERVDVVEFVQIEPAVARFPIVFYWNTKRETASSLVVEVRRPRKIYDATRPQPHPAKPVARPTPRPQRCPSG